MARETLPVALELMFGDEGGYSNRASDRGGPTKYGITHTTIVAHRGVSSVTADQVKGLTKMEAEDIYRRSYWGQSGGDLLPPGLDYAAFDFGVNSGPARAVKTLQKVVGAREDGHVGEQTLAAVRRYPGGVGAVIREHCAARMAYLRSLTNPQTGFPVNGRGWTIRVIGKDPKKQWADQPGVIGNALRLAANASGSDVEKTQTPPEAGAKADSRDTGLGEVLKKPEAWGPLGGLLSAGGALFAGNGPVQWLWPLRSSQASASGCTTSSGAFARLGDVQPYLSGRWRCCRRPRRLPRHAGGQRRLAAARGARRGQGRRARRSPSSHHESNRRTDQCSGSRSR